MQLRSVCGKIPAYIPLLFGTSSTNYHSRAVEEDVKEEKGAHDKKLSTIEYQVLKFLTEEVKLATSRPYTSKQRQTTGRGHL